MAGVGCNTRGNGKAMAAKAAEPPMHYRKGGFVKNPTRQPKDECAPPAPMPMAGPMPPQFVKKGSR